LAGGLSRWLGLAVFELAVAEDLTPTAAAERVVAERRIREAS